MGSTKKHIGYIYNGIVLKVVDGDTLDIMLDLGFATYRKVRCRLLDFNAPEAKTIEGDKITAYLREYITDQNVVVTSKSLDRYGRSLAYVHLIENGTLTNITSVLAAQFPTN
jgi:micrococcal nuclease